MGSDEYGPPPRPEDLTELRATVTFTFKVWNTGQKRTAADLARKFQGHYQFDQEELADTLRRSLDHEVKVEPVEAGGEGT